jgi:hypothetical protein
MVTLRSTQSRGLFSFFGGGKPAKPTSSGNAAAFKAGEKAFKATKGATPDLRRVVRLSLQHEAARKK